MTCHVLTQPRYTEADLLVSSDESLHDKNRFILRNAVIRSPVIQYHICYLLLFGTWGKTVQHFGPISLLDILALEPDSSYPLKQFLKCLGSEVSSYLLMLTLLIIMRDSLLICWLHRNLCW